jgi:hypothetical protein
VKDLDERDHPFDDEGSPRYWQIRDERGPMLWEIVCEKRRAEERERLRNPYGGKRREKEAA